MQGYLQKGIQTPWREAGPPNHHDDKVDLDQQVVNKALSLYAQALKGSGCRVLGLRDRGSGFRN